MPAASAPKPPRVIVYGRARRVRLHAAPRASCSADADRCPAATGSRGSGTRAAADRYGSGPRDPSSCSPDSRAHNHDAPLLPAKETVAAVLHRITSRPTDLERRDVSSMRRSPRASNARSRGKTAKLRHPSTEPEGSLFTKSRTQGRMGRHPFRRVQCLNGLIVRSRSIP